MRLSDTTFVKAQRGVPPEYWIAFSSWLSDTLGEIINEIQVLERCYCTDRMRGEGDNAYDYESEVVIPFIEEQIQKIVEVGRTDVPIVIMGDAGVGKTTFVHYSLRMLAKKDPTIVPFFFDFRHVSSSGKEDLSRVFNQQLGEKLVKEFKEYDLRSAAHKQELLERVFEEKLNQQLVEYNLREDRRARSQRLNLKIENLLDGYVQDDKLYNIMRVLYARREWQKQLVLVFDNFDHELHDDRFQENMFNLAKTVMLEFCVPVILPMRNYTRYDAFDRYGYMEAYKYRSFTLAPVMLDSMLKKRFDFIKASLAKQTAFTGGRVRLRATRAQMEANLTAALASYTRGKTWEFLTGLAGENARTLLGLVAKSLQSQHASGRRDRERGLSYERFLTTVVLGNNPVYNPEDREIVTLNLLDNDEPLSVTNTLIRIRLLQYLSYAGQAVVISSLYSEMERLGHPRASARKALNRFIKAGVSLTVPHHEREISDEEVTEVELGSAGRYYLDELLGNLSYVELVLPSTNVGEDILHELVPVLSRDASLRGVQGRHDALVAFARWLQSVESDEGTRSDASLRRELQAIYPRVSSILSTAIEKRFSGMPIKHKPKQRESS